MASARPYLWSSSKQPLYIVSDEAAEATIETHLASLTKKHVGFDLEWQPSFAKDEPEHPVALVQIATKESTFLFQISAMVSFPHRLKQLLEDPSIVKVGVGIQNDAKKLYRDYQISVLHCVDLSLLARSVDNARWQGRFKDPIGLSRLVETYFDLVLVKGRVARSNWTANLSHQQQVYAANDAHAGYTLYSHLCSLDTSVDPMIYSFHAIRGHLYAISPVETPDSMPSSEDVMWGVSSPLRPWFVWNPNYDPGPTSGRAAKSQPRSAKADCKAPSSKAKFLMS